MKNKNPFRSRKGVAVEYAIMIMVVIMGLSTIILTNSMLQASYRNRIEKEFFSKIDVESIGASFVYECTNNTNWTTWTEEWEGKYSDQYNVVFIQGENSAYRELKVYKGKDSEAAENLTLYIRVKQFGNLAPTIEIWERYS